MENFNVNSHASICISGANGCRIYFDPLNFTGEPHDGLAVFITHAHHDHMNIADIKKVIRDNDTLIVAPIDCHGELKNAGFTYVRSPAEVSKVNGIGVHTFPAYNIKKFRSPGVPFHPKENNWVGYIVNADGKKYVICGDTEFTPELAGIKDIDVLFIPCDGKYTMTAQEAAECAKALKPKLVVPIHYNPGDEKEFIKYLDGKVPYKIVL